MSGYTTVPTFTPGQVVTATDLNTYIRDNEGYFLNRPSQLLKVHKGSNYSLTGTSFAAIDTSLLQASKTLAGSAVYAAFEAIANVSVGTNLFLDLLVDGVRLGSGNDGITFFTLSATKVRIGFTVLVTGLTPGAHVFAPAYKLSAANTLTIFGGDGGAGTDFSPVFGIAEVG